MRMSLTQGAKRRRARREVRGFAKAEAQSAAEAQVAAEG